MENQQQKAKRPGRPRKPTSERKDKRERITLSEENAQEIKTILNALESQKMKKQIRDEESETWGDCLAVALRKTNLKDIDTADKLTNALLRFLFHILWQATKTDTAQAVLLWLYNYYLSNAIKEDSQRLQTENDQETILGIETMIAVFEEDREKTSIGIQALLDVLKGKIK